MSDYEVMNLAREAMEWAAEAIFEADPTGILSDQQAAGVAVAAFKRAAKRYNPTVGDWRSFSYSAIAADVRRCIAANEVRHPAEVVTDRVFGLEDGAR